MIPNRKNVDPRDTASTPVYQLETAMGAAVSVFDAAGAIRVPRTRFAPVKNTNDLLAVRSDCYLLSDQFQVVPNPERKGGAIVIDLDPRYYKLIDEFERHFPSGVPSLLDCEALTVRGDFLFGADVVLRGVVAMVNEREEVFKIEDRRCLQGEFLV